MPMNRHVPRFLFAMWLAAVSAVLIFATGTGGSAHGSPSPYDPNAKIAGPELTILAGSGVSNVYIPPPVVPASRKTQAATITVTYVNFPADARAAFEFAVNIWAQQLTSPVPIKVTANWTVLGAGVLGSAGAENLDRDFPNAPFSNTYYAIALANKLAGTDLDPSGPDISANFNSNFSSWYFGTTGNPASNQYDFVSVVLHELGHGLGFFGSMSVTGSQGFWGYSGTPVIYDRFAENGAGQALLNTSIFPNPSGSLGSQLTSNNVFFNGPNANAGNGGARVKLYAPTTWRSGSSYSHVDETTFPKGSANSLMTYALDQGEVIHNPGTVALGILKDIGWTLSGDVVPAPSPTSTPVANQNIQVGNTLVRTTPK